MSCWKRKQSLWTNYPCDGESICEKYLLLLHIIWNGWIELSGSVPTGQNFWQNRKMGEHLKMWVQFEQMSLRWSWLCYYYSCSLASYTHTRTHARTHAHTHTHTHTHTLPSSPDRNPCWSVYFLFFLSLWKYFLSDVGFQPVCGSSYNPLGSFNILFSHRYYPFYPRNILTAWCS